MIRKFWPILKLIFIGWGILCAFGALVIAGIITYQFSRENNASFKTASAKNVEFILNRCNLKAHRIEKVLHSYHFSSGFNGDHLNAHSLIASDFTKDELTPPVSGQGWIQCDLAEGVLKESMDWVGGGDSLSEIPWFPTREELRSAEYYVYPLSITCAGTSPIHASLIFAHPATRMICYISLEI